MATRLAVTHATSYRYEAPVTTSYNEARLEPRSDRRQTVLSWSLDVSPAVRVVNHVDYWGTMVHHFDLQVPHTELSVVAKAVVETGVTRMGPGEATWDDLASPEVRDRFYELLVPTAIVALDDESLVATAAEIRARATTPAEAAEAAVGYVNDRLAYEQGFTGVATTAPEVLAAGRGVCQDFAHLSLALLRTMGIPAWYVSGYLHPADEPEIGEATVGESHAWVAAWTGRVWPLDPTSLSPVFDRHVRVAAGRDYHDVPPFRGVYAGGGAQELEVTVEVTRQA
ncbi:transglutaminase family protein [Iamia sp. SCSIO 61187]|uniref:transglutaminase family protein n=1 Tax=Iamia sp. SCSIO 61187 TaxID=2722752 RepID=UPI001C62FF1F|nr:transglutaminase family protein [Iamia sp. SCSIO 61187]QYG92092.1 transglutaminase family protein [Iamia sp. SCSIO 61187]